MMILKEFPNTQIEPFIHTSPVDINYNCIAWAACDNTRWYEPDPYGYYYWPPQITREYTVESYINLYEFFGFQRCEDGNIEEGFIKVAVFEKNGFPTHASRQLDNGSWTSKLGKNIDVEHTLFNIQNGAYGNVIQFLKKSF